MRVTDKLIHDAKKKKEKNRSLPEEEEETFTYRIREKSRSVNTEPGAFGSAMEQGINTRKSIFDETAVFCTDTEQKTR